MDYEAILQKLEETEPFLISKLAIFYEMRNQIISENFSKNEIENLVNIVYSAFIEYAEDNDTPSGFAVRILNATDGGLRLKDILDMENMEFFEKI